MDGSDNEWNLVDLTAKEHYIVHHLLTKIYPNEGRIHNAFLKMVYGGDSKQKRDYRITSRVYENAKLNFGRFHSEAMKGENNPSKRPEQRELKRELALKQFSDPKQREIRSIAVKEYRSRPEVKQMTSDRMIGNDFGKFNKGKPSKLKGISHDLVTCPHCLKEGGRGGMKRHHFDNCKHKPIED